MHTVIVGVHTYIHIFYAMYVCLILESELKWATGDSSKYYVGYENIQPHSMYLYDEVTQGFQRPPFSLLKCRIHMQVLSNTEKAKNNKILLSCAEHILF